MNFQELMNKDLEGCTDMGGTCSHFYNDTSETIEFLYFEKNTEVIFDNQSEFSEIEANVPSVVFATNKTTNISHKSSIFEIYSKNYNVVSIQDSSDGTTRVYLGEQ